MFNSFHSEGNKSENREYKMRPETSANSSSQQRSLFRSSNEDRKKRDEATLRQMDEVTSKYLEKMEMDSHFFFGDRSGVDGRVNNLEANPSSAIVVPRFEPSEIVLETTIGMGEFGVVLKVGTVLLNNTSILNKQDNPEINESTESHHPDPVSFSSPLLWLSSEQNHIDHVETDRILRQELAKACQRSNGRASTAITPTASSSGGTYCDSLSLSQAATSLELSPMSSRDIPNNILLVIKQVRKDLYPKKRIEATKDLAREAKLLARLQQLYFFQGQHTAHRNNHPNIISLRGIVSNPGTPNFGIILDRLHLTLTELSSSWKKSEESILMNLATANSRKRKGASSFLSMARVFPNQVMETVIGVSQKVEGILKGQNQSHRESAGSGTEASEEFRSAAAAATGKRASPEALLLLGERILALWDVSEGMTHLHHHKILYRDLKTENVGRTVRSKVEGDNGRSPLLQNFDHRNQQRMQIFDFGLAKECKPSIRVSRYDIGRDGNYTDAQDAESFYDNYKMTGMTGTMRIMAPEVIKCLAYGLPADVYSFGICMWEVFTGTKCNFLSAAEICDTKNTVRPTLPVTFDTATEKGSVGMPKKLQRLMQACWHEDPGKRPSFCEISKILCSSLAEVHRKSPGPQDLQQQLPHQEPRRSLSSSFLSKGINGGKSLISPLRSCVNGNGAAGIFSKIQKQQKQQHRYPTMNGALETTDTVSDQTEFWSRLEAIRASGLFDD